MSDKYICPCRKLTKGDVKKAMKDGAQSYKEVKKATGAGTACGHCKSKIKKYVKKRLAEF